MNADSEFDTDREETKENLITQVQQQYEKDQGHIPSDRNIDDFDDEH